MGTVARSPKEPTGGTWPVRFGTAELVRDLDRPNGWMLLVDDTPQSYVDTDDPTHLEFEYVRVLADLIDALPPGPITALHLGGAACTLPRYVSATRPGSTQVVVDADDLLANVVREQLGTDGFRLRVGDAREALSQLSGRSDVIVTDVFVGGAMPAHLATLEAVRLAATVLNPGGVYAVNVGDSGRLHFARRHAAALAAVFANVVVLAEPAVLRGRRFGNIVLAGSDEELPWVGGVRVEDGREFARGALPATDADPPDVPVPPPALFAR